MASVCLPRDMFGRPDRTFVSPFGLALAGGIAG